MTRKLMAEFIGTAFLLMTVIGSTLMSEAFAGGYSITAHLAASLAAGGILVVLILMFGLLSGGHFNPAVTLARTISKSAAGIRAIDAPLYALIQIIGGIAAALLMAWLFRKKA